MKISLPCFLSSLFAVGVAAQPTSPLKLARTIALPGVSGRLDHLALDSQRQRLYLAASDANTVQIVDLANAKVLRPLPVRTPRDLFVLPKPNLLYVSSGQDGHVKVFDCAAERPIKTIGPLPDADNFRFDAPANRLYVGNDSALSMINVQTGVPTVSILLAGHPEAFVIEPSGGRIFVNVPDARHVAIIERLSREVVGTWPLEGVAGNCALALDESNQRLFVGCQQPPRLLVLEARSGQRVAECEIAADVDDLFHDAKRKRLYASCGDGFLEVIDQTDANRYVPQPRLPTAKGARTSLLAGETDSLFLAVPAQNGAPAEIRVYRLIP